MLVFVGENRQERADLGFVVLLATENKQSMIYNLLTIYLFIQDHTGPLLSARKQQNEEKHRTHHPISQSRYEEAMCEKKYRTPSLMHRQTTQDNPCQ
ncbi:hypothetical protein ACN38_g1435 [Penicillium nordicum]|uniref:Uncharacterized protein n=1 Tax=Penicillium nordicum TaxID=229535 RepID=A0A0M9WJU8_9EURO|nr:hypothetical protein ACN38_g1435 [Penicillium nordicum]